MRIQSRRILLTSIATAACGVPLYAALVGGDARSASGAERVAAGATAPAEFVLLRRARAERDRPSRAVDALVHGDAEQAARSRRPELPLGSPDVRVLPRDEEVCLLVETAGSGGFAGYGCAPWAHARAGRLHVTLSGGPAQEAGAALVVGLVPDRFTRVDARAGGTTQRLELSEGVYVARLGGPGAITLSAPDGEQTLDLAGLPGSNE